jgi:hypothetical protein
MSHAILFLSMDNQVRSVTWEAPAHHHTEKSADWFFAFGIIATALVIVLLMVGNPLLALLLAVGAGALGLVTSRPPNIIPYAVTIRGVRIDDTFFPYTTLQAYHIDENDPRGPQLLILSEKHFMPLLVIPIPEEYIDEIEDIMGPRLEETFLEESIFHKLLDYLGF